MPIARVRSEGVVRRSSTSTSTPCWASSTPISNPTGPPPTTTTSPTRLADALPEGTWSDGAGLAGTGAPGEQQPGRLLPDHPPARRHALAQFGHGVGPADGGKPVMTDERVAEQERRRQPESGVGPAG